ncbi:MAG TPA: sugar-binding domain-containing protein [Actinoplanes sp.]|nr:sugar-binding domain-containing protein [Actinoplanes sp.]
MSELVLAAAVARRYFLDDQTKVQIASAMQLSRFKVARLIDLARSSGIVRISVGSPGAVDAELSDRLRGHLGLRRAIVINTVDADDAATRHQLAELTAVLLHDVLTADDVLGLGWSRAVLDTAARLTSPAACDVVQLSGVLSHPEVTVNLVDAVDRLARAGGGHAYSFYAPLFVADPASVDVIRRQPDAAAATAQFSRVTTALVGVGCWRPPASNLRDELTAAERAALERDGVLADVAGILLDRAGEPLSMPLSRQMIGISADQLRSVPEVVALAYGRQKAPAVHIAVRAGYVSTLVTTAAFALALLDLRRPDL